MAEAAVAVRPAPPPPRETVQGVADFLAELAGRVRGELRTDTYTRMLYSTDASIYQVMPHGVLIARDEEDVHAAVEAAARHKVPILPRAAGSSLAGQAVNEALVIDTSRFLDRVVELNTEERWIRLQPGIVLDALNGYLRPHGLQFGPDPASSNRAGMGGIVGNNSTGSHSISYGMTADHVLGMQAILSDGTRCRLGPLDADGLAAHQARPGLEGALYRDVAGIAADGREAILAGTPGHWRRCGGYNLDRFVDGASFKYPQDPHFNLAKLVCGSEGTLAVMTELTLNLVPLPAHTVLAVVHFDELFAALSAVSTILETDPSAVELLDHFGLTLAREVPQYARLMSGFIAGTPNCVLITEYSGDNPRELEQRIGALQDHLRRHGVTATVVPVLDPALQTDVWTVRKVGLGLMMSIKGDYKPIPFIEDAAVPVEHLAEYVTAIERFCNDIGTRVAYYAHASAGCIHIRPLINAKLAAEVEKLPVISSFAVELLGRFGGSLSSEHGDGRARSWQNERFFGPDLYRLYQQVKGTFDPHGILNPGNVVDPPPMTETLRYGAGYGTFPHREHLSFRSDHGFSRAVEMCNGAGICRKRTEGTMCPSFMATREEEHSTRGRANALRAALSGTLPYDELTSERMFEVMDLCIECKACKAECPSSVDMAKIKIEFLATYYERHRVPLRSRLFADIGRASSLLAGPLAGAVNRLVAAQPVRGLLERFGGISARRTLPPFSGSPFPVWARRRGLDRPPAGAGRPVALFPDTFNSFNTPEVARAATEVLEQAGWWVTVPAYGCCGRPMLSKGLVRRARAAARATVARLAPLARAGVPIVGLEPSCVSAIRDEYRSLLPDDEDAALVAEHVETFEELIARAHADGELDLDLDLNGSHDRLLLHGHCHQKALIGTGPSKKTLGLTGAEVTEVDSGCCGMAGSFGYEAEHYDVSMIMAERRLLPAVRSLDGGGTVVAAGTSCRHQIMHGTGRRALHPAQVLHAALRGPRNPGQPERHLDS